MYCNQWRLTLHLQVNSSTTQKKIFISNWAEWFFIPKTQFSVQWTTFWLADVHNLLLWRVSTSFSPKQYKYLLSNFQLHTFSFTKLGVSTDPGISRGPTPSASYNHLENLEFCIISGEKLLKWFVSVSRRTKVEKCCYFKDTFNYIDFWTKCTLIKVSTLQALGWNGEIGVQVVHVGFWVLYVSKEVCPL